MRRGERWTTGRRGTPHEVRARATALFAALCTIVSVACVAPAPTADTMEARAVRSKLDSGLDLYEAGDFEVAGHRFRDAAAGARRCRDAEMERRARAAECAAWLRARRLDAFAECTAALEPLQRRARRSDPGVNTLVALGAIAGGRSSGVLRVPNAVAPDLREVAKEVY